MNYEWDAKILGLLEFWSGAISQAKWQLFIFKIYDAGKQYRLSRIRVQLNITSPHHMFIGAEMNYFLLINFNSNLVQQINNFSYNANTGLRLRVCVIEFIARCEIIFFPLWCWPYCDIQSKIITTSFPLAKNTQLKNVCSCTIF